MLLIVSILFLQSFALVESSNPGLTSKTKKIKNQKLILLNDPKIISAAVIANSKAGNLSKSTKLLKNEEMLEPENFSEDSELMDVYYVVGNDGQVTVKIPENYSDEFSEKQKSIGYITQIKIPKWYSDEERQAELDKEIIFLKKRYKFVKSYTQEAYSLMASNFYNLEEQFQATLYSKT